MSFNVINNPNFETTPGFTAAQFRKLDSLYLQGMRDKTLTYRTVECNFDKGLAQYTYYKHLHQGPEYRFVINHISPQTVHYELYKRTQGCIAKSSLFDRAYTKLAAELETL